MNEQLEQYVEWLDYIYKIKDQTTIYIYSRDQIGSDFPIELADKLKKIGLKHDFYAKRARRSNNWYAYASVLKNGVLCFESVSECKIEFEDKNILMISTKWNKKFGNMEPIFLDKKSNKNLWFQDQLFRGLVFVIYHEDKFLESRAFDVSWESNSISKSHLLSKLDGKPSKNWKQNLSEYSNFDETFIENMVLKNQWRLVIDILSAKVKSGEIQQDWVYVYYIGLLFEYLKDKKLAQEEFTRYKPLISKKSNIYKFINGYNVERLYSKLYLAKYFDKHQFEIENIAKGIKENTSYFSNYPVFVYWGQGIDSAPPIVQACYRKLKKVVPADSLVTLSESNVRNFINIPDYVNRIRLEHYANYSDYIRVAFLAKYGGAWVDATLFVVDNFYDQLLNYNQEQSNYSMDGPITVMGSWFRVYKQSSHLGERILQAAILFWLKNNSEFPMYFFIDFLAQYYADYNIMQGIQRDSFEWLKDQSMAIRNRLSDKFDEKWSVKVLNHQPVHKLTYKLSDWKNLNKKDSLYNAIIDGRYPFN